MPSFVPDVTVLAPTIDNPERFSVRYGGLVNRLSNEHGLAIGLVDGHKNYDEITHEFTTMEWDVDGSGNAVAGTASTASVDGVVRDLTMPKVDEMPVYDNPARFVNQPSLNRILKRKDLLLELVPEIHPQTVIIDDSHGIEEGLSAITTDKLIVKPVTGQRSTGIAFGTKAQLAEHLRDDSFNTSFMVQEFVDTSSGIAELGINGVHNLRVLCIGGTAVFGVSREEAGVEFLKDDYYGKFYQPEDLPAGMHHLVDEVNQALRPHGGDTSVIAIDLMRGINAAGEQNDYVCEVNRRPLRISKYDLLVKPQHDPSGLLAAAEAWDKSEAQLLASLVE